MGVERAKVAIVRVCEQDTYAALEETAGLIGGIGDLVRPSSKVLVKPNFTMGPTQAGITNPVVIEAVLRLVHAMGPQSIVVAEGSGASYTWGAFRAYNIYDIAARYGAVVMDLNGTEGVRREVPKETGREYVMLPRTVAESDVVVSVPTYKLWMDTPLSLSLKNLFGFYGGRYYGYNKDSRESSVSGPDMYIPGEVGSELGIHQPTVEQSIAAINLARPSDLTVMDALEGGDGQGNFIRLDLLMVGRNAVATDCVAMAVGGFDPEAQEQVQFCSRMGLGPCRLEEIEVLGEPIEKVRFTLARLQENVLELPVEDCLRKVSLGELRLIADALKMYHFLDEDKEVATSRMELTSMLLRVMGGGDYLRKAVACLPKQGRELLALLVSSGGTSGDFYRIRDEFVTGDRNLDHFWAGLRSVMRLGLAFLFHGQAKNYVVLAEGVTKVL